jgi:hypothetical protein
MKYLITLVLGLVIGAAGGIYLLGTPRAGHSLPGVAIQPPSPGGDAAGTAVVALDEKLFADVLGGIFHDLNSPTFQIARSGAAPDVSMHFASFASGCANTVTLLPEAGGVKTRVQFAGGKITLPLAFSGNYNLLGNCMQFKGWAQTNVQLSFDQAKQTVFGQLNVEGVNLEGVAPIANNFVTVFVQNAINQQVNPLELLRASQIAPVIPVKASGGSVKAKVKDVRAEVLDGSLKLHITYEFSGEKGQPPAG